MFTAPISAVILFVLIVSTALPDTSAFQTSSGVNSEQPDEPMTCPPAPVVPAVPVVPAEPPPAPLPPVPLVPIELPLHPTTPIAAASNNRRMARSYTLIPRRGDARPRACSARLRHVAPAAPR